MDAAVSTRAMLLMLMLSAPPFMPDRISISPPLARITPIELSVMLSVAPMLILPPP